MTEQEQKRFEEQLKYQASATDSKLNIELLSLEVTQKTDIKTKNRLDADLGELHKQRKLLGGKIARYQKDVETLCAKIEATDKVLELHKSAKKESIKLIKENKFDFELWDEVPYVESEQTEDLEDQEVFLDTWVDVRNRCNDLLFLSQVHGD